MELKKKYSGVVVPMITPLNDDLSIDINGVNNIIDLFISAGVSPFIIGTTGEAPSLSSQQKEELVKAVVERVDGKDLVYVGISSNCIRESIEDAKKYADLGADVMVATLPAYYPMNEEQMFKYFTQLADEINRPLIIYNMPATVKYSIPLSVIGSLSEHENIVGLKDSERDEERLTKAIELSKDREDFSYLLGWAAQSSYAMLNGADGIVPSTGNFTPELYKDLLDAALRGDKVVADELQQKTNYLGALYQKDRILSESIPALKVLMSIQGLCKSNVMPPMYKMDKVEEEEYIDSMKKELGDLKILK